MEAAAVRPGIVIEHAPTRRIYRVMWTGKMRLSSGEWLPAARYVNALEADGEEFYRPLSDFGSFILTTYGQSGA